MNYNTTLAAGVLAAVLGALGAGELFSSTDGRSLPQLSPVSNLVLALSAPLLWRFFFRTLLAYQNLVRFNRIQREAWDFLSGDTTWRAFSFLERKYGSVHEWRSPLSFGALVIKNLEYGYWWIFIALIVPLAWSFASIWDMSAPRNVSLGLLVTAIAIETFSYASRRHGFFRVWTREEHEEYWNLKCEPKEVQHSAESEDRV